MKKLYLLLLCIFYLVKAICQTGDLDPAFANKGIQMTSFLNKNRLSEDGRVVLKMSNGNFFIVFQVSNSYNYTTVTVISRYLFNGKIDSSYGNKGYSTPIAITAASAVMQGDKVIVAGTSVRADFALARVNADGTLDSTFGGVGLVTTDFNGTNDMAQAVAIQNGNIIVAGSTNIAFSFNNDFGVARYTPDGFLDSSFGRNGIVITDFNGKDDVGQSVVILNDKIIVAGYTVVIDSLFGYFRDDFALARYNADGSPDSSFGNNGLVTTDFDGGKDNAQSVAIQGDKIVVAGYTSSFNTGAVNLALARYNLNGSLDTTFNGHGILIAAFAGWTGGYAYSITVQGDKILIAGQVTGTDSLFFPRDAFAIARYNSSGSLDSTFGKGGLVATEFGNFDAAHSVVIQNNKIIVAGITSSNTIDNDFAIAQYNADGSLDSTFNEDGLLVSYYPSGETYFTCAAMQGDKIVAAGYINNNITNNSFLIARYNSDGSLDSSFNGNGFVTRDFDGFSAIIQSITLQGDKILVAGNTYPFIDFVVARYNSDGSPDSTFSEDGVVTTDYNGSDDRAQSVVVWDDKIIVAGSSYNFNTFHNDFAIAQYKSDGSLDASFGTGGLVTTDFAGLDDYAQSVVIQHDKIVVAGSNGNLFSSGNNFALARYNSNGSLDSSFGANGLVTTDVGFSNNDFGRSVALQGNNIVVAGYTYDANNYKQSFAIARYKSDGSLDTSFNKNGLVTTDFQAGEGRSLVVEGDKIIVGGIALSPGTFASNFAIVRYNKDGSLDSTFSQDGIQITGKDGNAYSLQKIVLHGNRLYAVGSIELSGIITYGAVAAYQLEESLAFFCPKDKILSTDQGGCTAVVNDIDPAINPVEINGRVIYTLSGATTGNGTGSAGGTVFNKGVTTVTYSLNNDAAKTCSFTVTVLDKEPPVISRAFASPFLLWPPDHEMRGVNINYFLADNCGAKASLAVTSSDPQDGTGPGDLSPDWKILDAHHVRLRAESAGFGYGGFFYFGRIYTIHIKAEDAAGNNSFKKVRVLVPPEWLYNYVNKKEPVDDLQVSVMPNPSNNSFTLLLKGKPDKPLNLRVSDELGRVVETKTGITLHGILKVGEKYPTGMYYAEVMQGDRRVVVKLLKLSR